MKNLYLTVFGLFCIGAFAQNSPTWPSTGNVGIGTSTPTVKLDVITTIAHSPIDPYDYAFFGRRTFDRNNTPLNNGLFIQQRWFALGLNYVTRLRTVIDNINKG